MGRDGPVLKNGRGGPDSPVAHDGARFSAEVRPSRCRAKISATRPICRGPLEQIRRRFLSGRRTEVSDQELLELLLASVLPRLDVRPVASALLEACGGITGIVEASEEELRRIPGITEDVYLHLELVLELSHRIALFSSTERDLGIQSVSRRQTGDDPTSQREQRGVPQDRVNPIARSL